MSSESPIDAAANKLARDPALLYKIKQDLDKRIVGEDDTKLLLFMIAASSLTNTPLGAIITGESSAGKSYLLNEVLKYFGNVIEFTRMTEASPDRMEQGFKQKILKIEELHGASRAQAKIRILISEGKLRLLTTEKDEQGNIYTDVKETNGVPVFMTTTTSVTPDEELLNRIFMVSVDESKEQTERIVEFQAKQYEDVDFELAEADPIIKKFLGKILVTKAVIPYATLLYKSFPCDTIKARRDFKKLLNLVGVSAILHQYRRPIIIKNHVTTIAVALPQDLFIAWRIVSKSLQETLFNLQERTRRILDLFDEYSVYTVADIAARSGYSTNRTREILNSLVNYAFLRKDETKRPYKYMLGENTKRNTMSEFVEEYKSVDGNMLKTFLEQQTRNTRKVCMGVNDEGSLEPMDISLDICEKLSSSFIDPFDGSVVVRASRSNSEISTDQQLEQETSTNLTIVPATGLTPYISP